MSQEPVAIVSVSDILQLSARVPTDKENLVVRPTLSRILEEVKGSELSQDRLTEVVKELKSLKCIEQSVAAIEASLTTQTSIANFVTLVQLFLKGFELQPTQQTSSSSTSRPSDQRRMSQAEQDTWDLINRS